MRYCDRSSALREVLESTGPYGSGSVSILIVGDRRRDVWKLHGCQVDDVAYDDDTLALALAVKNALPGICSGRTVAVIPGNTGPSFTMGRTLPVTRYGFIVVSAISKYELS